MLNTSHCIFTISKRNMTWCWNINNWESITHKLIKFIKSWSLTCNIVEATVYMNYHDMFMIMITWTWHDMNCHCLTAWCCLRTTSNLRITKRISLRMIFSDSLLKYIRYKLNCFTCSHENKITRYLLSQWKILRRLSNQNHMLTYDHLYQKNIMIWLIFLRDRTLMSCSHIRKNTTSKLIWN